MTRLSFAQSPDNFLANPQDIKLKGNVREENISTSLGRMNLRWPRKAETLFGRTPIRALADSSRTAARFLNLAGFKSTVRNLDLTWDIVFMDEEVPSEQVPGYLVSNCHPGWMIPPTKIYIVAQRVVHGCGGVQSPKSGKVADADLARVLLHEIGHSIEFQLWGGRMGRERFLREGFATWFTYEAAEYSQLFRKGELRNRYYSLAKRSLEAFPSNWQFHGSGHDYARSSLYYSAIKKQGSVGHLMDIYDYQLQGMDFFSAVKKRMGWSRKSFEQKIRSIAD